MVPTAEAEPPPVSRAPIWIRSVPADSFAFVMATAIVSIGLQQAGFGLLSTIWFLLAAAGLVFCGLALPWRWVTVPGSLRADLGTPAPAFGLLTLVVGLALLGVRSAADTGTVLPPILLVVAAVLWVVLGYLVPWTVLRAAAGRDLTGAVDGSWLLWTLAGQAVAVLATILYPRAVGSAADALVVLAVLGWGVGLGLALIIGTALVFRVLRHGVSAAELTPASWYVLGAAAGAGLAGSALAGVTGSRLAEVVAPMAAASVPVAWTVATWMILPLLALGWWRHGLRGVPFRYDTTLWSIVFSLGAYGLASLGLGTGAGVPVISWIGHTFLWAAAGAWLVVATAGVVQAVLGRPWR